MGFQIVSALYSRPKLKDQVIRRAGAENLMKNLVIILPRLVYNPRRP